jgi:epoxyqueuosine reductase
MINEIDRSHFIKKLALQSGFEYCGIAPAQPLDEDARRLERWLSKGMHGSMTYMEKYFDLRVNPEKLLPGAKSVITLLLNYYPEKHQSKNLPKVSSYAYGQDYHEVIKSKLNFLLAQMKEKFGEFHGRGFVDSAPVLERSWAVKSGLGWVGKNGNLINKKNGSFFFIATLIVDLKLAYDDPFVKDFCGSCSRCVDACPTNAILEDKVIDGSRCISYFTIELKDLLIPENMRGKFDDWVFGCDTCQDVCPWNRFSTVTKENAFNPLPEIFNFTINDWEELTEENFKKIFQHSPIKRAKFSGIKRNLQFVKNRDQNPGGPKI